LIFKRFIRWLRRRRQRGRKYKIPLDEIIERSLKRFAENTGFAKPICPQCFLIFEMKRAMEFRLSNIVNKFPRRDDIAFKCFFCYHTLHHGIPISKKIAEEEIDLRGHTLIMQPSKRTDEIEYQETIERLKKLGYIE